MLSLLNGHSEHQKALDARHYGLRMIFKLVLWIILVQFVVLTFFASPLADSQRALTVVTRVIDNFGNILLTLVGALVGIIRGAPEGGQRAGDKPSPTPTPTPEPEKP